MKYQHDLKNCWGVTDRIADKRLFFLALKSFTMNGLVLYLEGVHTAEAVYGFLQKRAMPIRESLEYGTVNPARDRLFHLPMASRFLDDLAELLLRYNFHVDHVALYKNTDILLSFWDAFMRRSIIDISKELGSQSARQFCNTLGVSLEESRDVYPELYEE